MTSEVNNILELLKQRHSKKPDIWWISRTSRGITGPHTMAQCKRRLNTIKSNDTVHIINNVLAHKNPPPWELVQAPVQSEKKLDRRVKTDSEQHDLRKGKCIKCGCTEAAIQTYKWTCRRANSVPDKSCSFQVPANRKKKVAVSNQSDEAISSADHHRNERIISSRNSSTTSRNRPVNFYFNPYIPKCPICQSPRVGSLTLADRLMTSGFIGTAGKSMKCFNCSATF